ncbi:glycosyltransferase [Rhodobacteraceae bacterium 2CG4]|uniref:Glycosyltransferase n=1 Tax=Halovulum marinum TaxID=2662447 RepID=A0A6L5Z2W9_9RHOB|nr:glycosyltransferase family 4 protein [Halovulum marinum]MSU90352.1 glycosyltransferase [Halovulum marinum]
MRIAQIAPLAESVPPKFYGGTERVVSYLTEELVRQGHQVSLFASADSETSAELFPGCAQALRLDPDAPDHLPYHILMLEQVRRRADMFDVLHFHTDYLHFPMFRDLAGRSVTTMHGRQDLPYLAPIYASFTEYPIVSISDHQRRPVPLARWAATVHHGLPHDLLGFAPHRRRDYLAFLGRISPEKRPDRAIEIARRAGLPLKIAAKVDRVDRDYFETCIRPLFDPGFVEFIGEIGEHEKSDFLGGATALLFPIDWPEPFGLVMIEAMTCGTPVIAWRRGSVPEIVAHGVTGFMVENVAEAVEAVGRAQLLQPEAVRAVARERFGAERMARDYLALYQRLLDRPEAAAVPAMLPAANPAGAAAAAARKPA